MNAPSVILVTGETSARQRSALAAIAPDASLRYSEVPDAEGAIDDVEVVAGFVPPVALRAARRLRWIQSWAAGPDPQLFPEMVDSPVVLTCCKGNGAIPLAEHAMMLMLLLNRNAPRWLEAQRRRQWDRFVHGELNGLTCGIVGAGHSGRDLALKAKAFHMRVVGLRRRDGEEANFDRMYARSDLHEFLAGSDFVVVTAPRTRETTGMLGEAEFRAMKRSAFYVCFSRGGIADDTALIRALGEGWIAGAGLDAHGEEPLPPDSPFWTAPNTIVTPHNGATTQATRERGFEIFATNLRRYLAGEELLNVVDKRHGY